MVAPSAATPPRKAPTIAPVKTCVGLGEEELGMGVAELIVAEFIDVELEGVPEKMGPVLALLELGLMLIVPESMLVLLIVSKELTPDNEGELKMSLRQRLSAK